MSIPQHFIFLLLPVNQKNALNLEANFKSKRKYEKTFLPVTVRGNANCWYFMQEGIQSQQ